MLKMIADCAPEVPNKTQVILFLCRGDHMSENLQLGGKIMDDVASHMVSTCDINKK